ncbi:uncharacterized protein B0T15DRAFT_481537 [Chaetomium strumarium]|uniref:F-box domain-containing protein n=1 Tax=Chaetomium strumarium TaxID=1170767 RepID=A0AAJ0H1D0_9PEZI|nr:hypothetical protein B0T15DRAFT_481537 [Chaetomium strumarium]
MSPLQPLPAFLQLPADIVLYLSREHLPPALAVALSLTCKALFNLIFPRARFGLDMNAVERQDLQLLLEKDLGHTWWCCHYYSLLHPISTRGPTGGTRHSYSWMVGWYPSHPYHNRRWLEGSSFSIDYQSVRLAMNRYFFGPSKGLPLESFSVEASSTTLVPWQGKWLPWEERWSARIVQDELFLSATRTLSGAGWTDDSLRAAIDHEERHICGHIRTSGPAFCSPNPSFRPSPTWSDFCYIRALLRPTSPSVDIFTPCHDLIQSCRRCLTDFAITVEQRLEDVKEGCVEEQPAAFWFISVTSYQRLGSGRSPMDPKWEAFGNAMTVSAHRTQRDMSAYPPGAVKAMWESHEPRY